MIAIASSVVAERSALVALCETRGWATIECHSVRATIRSLQRHHPRIIVIRQRLDDGHSDDVIAALTALGRLSATKLIVLLDAGLPSTIEVRQIALGADCVLRNPIRTDVLTAYIGKYVKLPPPAPAARPNIPPATVAFCGGSFAPVERTLQFGRHRISLSPREASLVDLLTQCPGIVVSYEQLYSEILGRRFRGDTSNMRVLLGKLAATCQTIGLSIRPFLLVISKAGYRYDPPAVSNPTAIANQ